MAGVTNIRVKDFGPIAEASVDLKPLTIFMGPNNSGKSYLALATYCLFRTLVGEPLARGGIARTRPRVLTGTLDLLEQARVDIIKAWPDARSVPDKPIKVGEMPKGLQSALLEANKSLGDAFGIQFQTELERCYGTQMDSLAKRSSTLMGPCLEIEFSRPDKAFSCDMLAADGRVVVKSWENNLLEQTIQIGPMSFSYNDLIDVGWSVIFMAFELEASSQRPGRMTHYIPASRSAILFAHKTLVGNIVDSASRAWVEPIATPKLTGVVTDFIRALLMSAQGKSPSPNLQDVISFLEKDVAHGSLYMDESLEYPEIRYENDIGSFSVHQVSSMVSEIAPIVLYLKHLVREGHLFIIEEPESHLDAENQMKLARAIAMLVNAGVYVLITTHSDFFVNQLNNLLLLSRLTPRRRAARKYSASEVLQPSDVGAYLFKQGPEGSTVRPLEVTAIEGIPTEPFSDAHSDLYDEAIALEHIVR